MSDDLLPKDVPSNNDTDSYVDVEYGVRRSWRRTNFLRRDSSSLYPVQFMDIEVYLTAAQFALSTATHLLPIFSFFITLHNVEMSAYRALERTTRPGATVGAMLREDLSSRRLLSPDASQSFFAIDTTKRIKYMFKGVLLVHAYYINGHIRCQLHAR